MKSLHAMSVLLAILGMSSSRSRNCSGGRLISEQASVGIGDLLASGLLQRGSPRDRKNRHAQRGQM
jgi:VIT1/CCC1 family predicted Fe2+/Mn2+ transporter